jgi:hypothetical protein
MRTPSTDKLLSDSPSLHCYERAVCRCGVTLSWLEGFKRAVLLHYYRARLFAYSAPAISKKNKAAAHCGCLRMVDLANILHSVCYTSVISKRNDIVILLLRCIYVFLMMMTTVTMMTMMMAIMMMTMTMRSSDAPDI